MTELPLQGEGLAVECVKAGCQFVSHEGAGHCPSCGALAHSWSHNAGRTDYDAGYNAGRRAAEKLPPWPSLDELRLMDARTLNAFLESRGLDWRVVPDQDELDAAEHIELRCQRCLRPNVWSWHAPSPLWNAVMRDPATGMDRWNIVCPRCFAELAEASGIVPAESKTWHFGPENFDVTGLWTDPDGRTWDATQCLWIDPPAALQAEPSPETVERVEGRVAELESVFALAREVADTSPGNRGFIETWQRLRAHLGRLHSQECVACNEDRAHRVGER